MEKSRLSQAEASFWAKQISRDFDVDTPEIRFAASNSDAFGCYCHRATGRSAITLYGEEGQTLETLCHELVHHIQHTRTGSTSHRVGFFRLAFQLREETQALYGIRLGSLVSTLTHLQAFDTAIVERRSGKKSK